MKYSKIIVIIVLFVTSTILYCVGNIENIEMSSSINRQLASGYPVWMGDHWHAGTFQTFEFNPHKNK